jgi:hypothetical protein
MIPADRGLAALAQALEAAGCVPSCAGCGAEITYHADCDEGDGTLVWEADAAAILGERAVFLPEGLLIDEEWRVPATSAIRKMAKQAATIAALRDRLWAVRSLDLDTILLRYVNRPFGQAEAIACRDSIRLALAKAQEADHD